MTKILYTKHDESEITHVMSLLVHGKAATTDSNLSRLVHLTLTLASYFKAIFEYQSIGPSILHN